MKTTTKILLMVAMIFQTLTAVAQAPPAPTVTLTITPTTGQTPAAATLTWSSTGAASCTASGSWTGTKATSGTQALTGITADATYTLKCDSAVGNGQATLSWTPPTQNTDGTALTNLAGYRIVYGTSSTTMTNTVQIANAGTTTYIVDNLTPGPKYFAVRSYNSAGAESVNSNVANKTIVGSVSSTTKSAAFDAVQVPNAPTNLVAVETTAMNTGTFDPSQWRVKPNKVVGTVPLGTDCDETRPATGGWYRVPKWAVSWSGSIRTDYPLAKCGESAAIASLTVE
jgi:hypothetical protein